MEEQLQPQQVKQEITELPPIKPRETRRRSPPAPEDVIDLSDSDDDDAVTAKKQKVNGVNNINSDYSLLSPAVEDGGGGACKSFWKAGDYEGVPHAQPGNWDYRTGGMDHVRVHPKFLHSNATSHKWVLGAFAELLDNALDEVSNGATYVNLDMLINKKDGSQMLLVEDNGGGMDPEKMRQCMSLGYSEKSKMANTIGQYGNGFKTSTMRLGADVIVFSRSRDKAGKSVTQSIGLLSYTFLRRTGKEDIVVPILDYERKQRDWVKIMRSSAEDWDRNVDTIMSWSPYSSESELLQQFNLMKEHGTRVVIYNLWEDDQGQLELDFKSDPHVWFYVQLFTCLFLSLFIFSLTTFPSLSYKTDDVELKDIQIRGANRDERNIQMAKEYPNSRHFLTYRHSLRSYVSILYLRLPPTFRIILRGKDVEHHNIVNDMMMTEEVTYRPSATNGVLRDTNMVAVVTIGFVKDATAHIDVQGFNVYHKNRLIKPFWRVWNAAGSDGRGVIGVLEANFVEPAHDKQGFERTTVLARLECKLVQMQKTYWSTQCHKIGYAPRRHKKNIEAGDRESSPDFTPSRLNAKKKKNSVDDDKFHSRVSHKQRENVVVSKYASVNEISGNGHPHHTRGRTIHVETSSTSSEDSSDDSEQNTMSRKRMKEGSRQISKNPDKDRSEMTELLQKESTPLQQETTIDDGAADVPPSNLQILDQLKDENRELEERLKRKEEEILGGVLNDLQLEREKRKSLEIKLQEAEKRIEELNKEQESLIDIFSEERDRRDIEEEHLRKRLRDASNTIEELREKLRVVEQMKTPNRKW